MDEDGKPKIIRSRISDEQKLEAVRLRRRGLKYSEISKLTGIRESSLQVIISSRAPDLISRHHRDSKLVTYTAPVPHIPAKPNIDPRFPFSDFQLMTGRRPRHG